MNRRFIYFLLLISVIFNACEEPFIEPPLDSIAYNTYDTSNYIEINNERLYHINTLTKTYEDSLVPDCSGFYYNVNWWNGAPYCDTRCKAVFNYQGECCSISIKTSTKNGTLFRGYGYEFEKKSLLYSKDSSEAFFTFKNAKMYLYNEDDTKYFRMSGRLKLNLKREI